MDGISKVGYVRVNALNEYILNNTIKKIIVNKKNYF